MSRLRTAQKKQARAHFTRKPNQGTKAQKDFLLTPTRSLFPSSSSFSIYLPANCSVTTPLSIAPGVLDRMCDRWVLLCDESAPAETDFCKAFQVRKRDVQTRKTAHYFT